jgi:hypothetical protein
MSLLPCSRSAQLALSRSGLSILSRVVVNMLVRRLCSRYVKPGDVDVSGRRPLPEVESISVPLALRVLEPTSLSYCLLAINFRITLASLLCPVHALSSSGLHTLSGPYPSMGQVGGSSDQEALSFSNRGCALFQRRGLEDLALEDLALEHGASALGACYNVFALAFRLLYSMILCTRRRAHRLGMVKVWKSTAHRAHPDRWILV